MNMQPDFSKSKDGLIPVIVQEADSLQVLMLAYMNEPAFQKTLDIQKVTFFSRSKKRLWTKGETSGNFLIPVDFSLDCDADTLLIKAKPMGNVCHLDRFSCFGPQESQGFLHLLSQTIAQRIQGANTESYTYRLAKSGLNRLAQKVGEEAVEVVIAAKDDNLPDFKGEVADLLFHLLVLIQYKGIDIKDIEEKLYQRHLNAK